MSKVCDSCGTLAPDTRRTRILPGDNRFYEMLLCRHCHNDFNAQYQLDPLAFAAYMRSCFSRSETKRTATPVSAPPQRISQR